MTKSTNIRTFHGAYINTSHIVDVQSVPSDTYKDSAGNYSGGAYCKRLVTMVNGREHFVHVGILLDDAPEYLDMSAPDVLRALDYVADPKKAGRG